MIIPADKAVHCDRVFCGLYATVPIRATKQTIARAITDLRTVLLQSFSSELPGTAPRGLLWALPATVLLHQTEETFGAGETAQSVQFDEQG